MKKLALVMGILAAVLSTNVAAESEGDGAFFGVNYMRFDLDLEGESAKPTGIALNFGKFFHKNIGIEAMVAFGLQDDEFYSQSVYVDLPPQFGGAFDVAVSISAELSKLFGAGAIAKFPIGDKAEVYGKAGLASLEWDVVGKGSARGVSQSVTSSFDDTGAYFGLGATVEVGENSSLLIEYLKLPEVDVGTGDTAYADVIPVDVTGKIKSTSINIGFRHTF